jgi:hypothetical protein
VVRSRHPNKEIEAAVRYAEGRGWTWRKGTSHAWGVLHCPRSTREGCKLSVWSTPKNPQNHANRIRRAIDRCPHGDG